MPRSSPALTPLEAALVDMTRVALTSSPSAVRQLARRLAKSPPTDANKVEVQAQLSSLLAAALPDSSPLRRSQPAHGLPAPLPPPSEGGSGKRARVIDARVSADTAIGRGPRRADNSTPIQVPNVQRPVLPPATQALIDELIDQRRNSPLLARHGLAPATKFMFVGPPGVGKTMTAAYLANEFAVPMIAIDPTTIMSSFLGSSAKNLRGVLDSARDQDCIVFFDEFDALAKSRDDAHDVGEVKRVVNSLLLELDRSDKALVIAATNYDQALDKAVNRRFDVRVDFPLPGLAERRTLISRHPALVSLEVSGPVIDVLALATHDWSPSDIQKRLNQVTRSAILSSDDHGSTSDAARAVARWGLEELMSKRDDVSSRREMAAVAVTALNYSHRQAAELLGVTHPTISKWLKLK